MDVVHFTKPAGEGVCVGGVTGTNRHGRPLATGNIINTSVVHSIVVILPKEHVHFRFKKRGIIRPVCRSRSTWWPIWWIWIHTSNFMAE